MIRLGISLWPNVLLVLTILAMFGVMILPLGSLGSYARARVRLAKLWIAYSLSALLTLWALLSLLDHNPLATVMGATVIWSLLGAVRGSFNDIKADFELAKRYSRNQRTFADRIRMTLQTWRKRIVAFWQAIKLRVQREYLHWLDTQADELQHRLTNLEAAKIATRQKIAAQTGVTLMMPAPASHLAVGAIADPNVSPDPSG